MDALLALSAYDQLMLLRQSQLTPSKLTDVYIAQIDKLNDSLGAFVHVSAEDARERAASLEKDSQDKYLLWGMPHADKDLVERRGMPTGYGSRAGGLVAEESAPISQLADELGMVNLGKTNTPEFGFYGYTESDVSPPARHPLAPELGAGGSSGGAAVAVAAHMLPWAIGSDGGGSVRIPAATVGLVGLKPTLGRLRPDREASSIVGVVNGPITRNVRDAALLFDGLTENTSRSLRALSSELPRLSFAATADSPWDGFVSINPDSAVLQAWQNSIEALQHIGMSYTGEVDWNCDYYGETFRDAWWRSAAGMPENLPLELLNPVTRYFVEAGRSFDHDRIDRNIANIHTYQRETSQKWKDWDILVTPALGQLPQPVGHYSTDPEENFAQQIHYSPYTSWVNLTGRPAITVPVSTHIDPYSGVRLPVGVQLVGRHGSDELLLQVAFHLERYLSLGPVWAPPTE